MKFTRLLRPCAALCLVTSAWSQALPAAPQAPILARQKVRIVATTSTQMPGQTYDFTTFYNVCIDGGNLSFNGGNFLFAEGIYFWNAGQLTRVVDSTQQIPGLPPGHPFAGFSGSSLDGDRVAFLGALNAGQVDYEGIFVWRGGNMQTIVEKGDAVTQVPNGIYFFLFPPSMSAGEVVWNGLVITPGADIRALYSSRGGNHILVDTSDGVPGQGRLFGDFNFNPTVGSALGFAGALSPGDFVGVYGHDDSLAPGQELFAVADFSTQLPGSNRYFDRFYDGVTSRAGEFAFRAGSGLRLGVYSTKGGLHSVADTTTLIPGRAVPFTGFNQWSEQGPALDGNGDLAFVGEGAGGLRGIYVERSGTLRRVIETGDSFAGKTVSWVDLGREGLDGGVLGLVIGFDDGTAAVIAWSL